MRGRRGVQGARSGRRGRARGRGRGAEEGRGAGAPAAQASGGRCRQELCPAAGEAVPCEPPQPRPALEN